MSRRDLSAAEVATILDGLPPEQAAVLSERLELPCWARARRYKARDEAVLACFDELPHVPITHAARRIEVALGRYLSRSGQNLSTPTTAFDSAIVALAVANHGKPLGVRQLLNISSGRRR